MKLYVYLDTSESLEISLHDGRGMETLVDATGVETSGTLLHDLSK